MVRHRLTHLLAVAVLTGTASLAAADDIFDLVPGGAPSAPAFDQDTPDTSAASAAGVQVTDAKLIYLRSNKMVIRGKFNITGRPHKWQYVYFELLDANGRQLQYADGKGVQKKWGSVFTPDNSGTVLYNDTRVAFELDDLRNISGLPRGTTTTVYVRMILWDPIAKQDLARGDSFKVAVQLTTDAYGNVVRISRAGGPTIGA